MLLNWLQCLKFTMVVPQHSDVIPDKHETVSSYKTRIKNDCFIPRGRLESVKKSFVHDSIRLWNVLKAVARKQSKSIYST